MARHVCQLSSSTAPATLYGVANILNLDLCFSNSIRPVEASLINYTLEDGESSMSSPVVSPCRAVVLMASATYIFRIMLSDWSNVPGQSDRFMDRAPYTSVSPHRSAACMAQSCGKLVDRQSVGTTMMESTSDQIDLVDLISVPAE